MKKKITLIIDRIAIGVTKYKRNIIKEMLPKCKSNVIKGNVSEILYLGKEEN
ncbi:hypothetical protein [Plasmodium yoelii yoelii]|uniref:hydroxyethylthiazole kinase n=1 Tax=Plasmodium yoelii yoelii TaxID=73239 RepID=Q7RHG4_PLAYO|nr:hypothetical protein [Plasmodium yoelii yoelii]